LAIVAADVLTGGDGLKNQRLLKKGLAWKISRNRINHAVQRSLALASK